MTLADLAPGRLSHDGECLDEEIVEVLAISETLTKFDRSVGECLVGKGLGFSFECVDFGYQSLKGSDLLAFAGSEEFV
jgi:hypothetical protein